MYLIKILCSILVISSSVCSQEKLSIESAIKMLTDEPLSRQQLSKLLIQIRNEEFKDKRLAVALRKAVDRLRHPERPDHYVYVFRRYLPTLISEIGKQHPDSIPDLLAIDWTSRFSRNYVPAFNGLGPVPLEATDKILRLAGRKYLNDNRMICILNQWKKIAKPALDRVIQDWPKNNLDQQWALGVTRCLSHTCGMNQEKTFKLMHQISEHPDPAVRKEFWRAFTRYTSIDEKLACELIGMVVKGLNDDKQEVILQALGAVFPLAQQSRLTSRTSIKKKLFELARESPDINLKIKSIELLGRLGYPGHRRNDAATECEHLLIDSHPEVRAAAVRSLTFHYWSKAAFESYWKDYFTWTRKEFPERNKYQIELSRNRLARYCTQFLSESSQKLRSLDKNLSKQHRMAILGLVRQIRSNVFSVTAKPSPTALQRIVSSQEKLRPIILHALKDKDPVVRAAGLFAAEVQFQFECDDVIRHSTRLLQDPDPLVRFAAGRTFASCAVVPPEAVPGLVRLLRDPPIQSQQSHLACGFLVRNVYRAATTLQGAALVTTHQYGYQVPSKVAAAALACVNRDKVNPLLEILKIEGKRFTARPSPDSRTIMLVGKIRMDDAIAKLAPLDSNGCHKVTFIIRNALQEFAQKRPPISTSRKTELQQRVRAGVKILVRSNSRPESIPTLLELFRSDAVDWECKTDLAHVFGNLGSDA